MRLLRPSLRGSLGRKCSAGSLTPRGERAYIRQVDFY